MVLPGPFPSVTGHSADTPLPVQVSLVTLLISTPVQVCLGAFITHGTCSGKSLLLYQSAKVCSLISLLQVCKWMLKIVLLVFVNLVYDLKSLHDR